MTNPWTTCLLVGSGGFAGSVTRYGLSVVSQRLPIKWPFGTLAANVLGCLLIGIVTELSARSELVPVEIRLAVATGFCGGFTTMSSMIYETSAILRAGEYLHAAVYAAGSLFLSLAAFAIGLMSLRMLIRLGARLWS